MLKSGDCRECGMVLQNASLISSATPRAIFAFQTLCCSTIQGTVHCFPMSGILKWKTAYRLHKHLSCNSESFVAWAIAKRVLSVWPGLSWSRWPVMQRLRYPEWVKRWANRAALVFHSPWACKTLSLWKHEAGMGEGVKLSSLTRHRSHNWASMGLSRLQLWR